MFSLLYYFGFRHEKEVPKGERYLKFAPKCQGAWGAQSVERPTSAEVMISRFVGSSPASGSVLTAQSLEPASDSVSLSPTHALPLSLSLSLKTK